MIRRVLPVILLAFVTSAIAQTAPRISNAPSGPAAIPKTPVLGPVQNVPALGGSLPIANLPSHSAYSQYPSANCDERTAKLEDKVKSLEALVDAQDKKIKLLDARAQVGAKK